MVTLAGNPNYQLTPGGYKQPDLFTLWYNKYVKGGPAPARSYRPPSGVGQPTPTAGIPAIPAPTAPTPAPHPAAPTATPAPSVSERFNVGLQDPAKQGLLATGLSLMATPPRRVPYSGAEIIGRAGLAGLEAYRGALSQQRRGAALAATEKFREAQLQHYKTLDEKAQAEIAAGKEREAVYQDMVSAGAAERLAEQRGISVDLAKIALRNAVVDGKGIDDLMKPRGGKISKSLAEALGRPKLEGENIDDVKGLSSFAKVDKEEKKDFKMISIDGKTPHLANLNDKDVQKAIAEGRVVLHEKGGAEKLQTITDDDGTVRVINLSTKKVVKDFGKIGKKTRGVGGGVGEKQFQLQRRMAIRSLEQRGNTSPTERQISEERRKLYPRSITQFDQLMEAMRPGGTLSEEGTPEIEGGDLSEVLTPDQALRELRRRGTLK